MPESLTLSRGQLHAFLECKRQFELRYLRRMPWPQAPLKEEVATAVSRGHQFHQLLERHFLGLPIDAHTLDDNKLRQWWHDFSNSELEIPNGHFGIAQHRRYLPEHRLTIPAGNHFLLGRFDLLVIGDEGGRPFAHLFDWKTSRPRAVADLYADWQTRLYLAMLAESGDALLPNQRLHADQISMTYWYVKEPDQPRTIVYDKAKHQDNWAEILQILDDLDENIARDTWPLVDSWMPCRNCSYQVYCGRQTKQPPAPETILDDLEEDFIGWSEETVVPEIP